MLHLDLLQFPGESATCSCQRQGQYWMELESVLVLVKPNSYLITKIVWYKLPGSSIAHKIKVDLFSFPELSIWNLADFFVCSSFWVVLSWPLWLKKIKEEEFAFFSFFFLFSFFFKASHPQSGLFLFMKSCIFISQTPYFLRLRNAVQDQTKVKSLWKSKVYAFSGLLCFLSCSRTQRLLFLHIGWIQESLDYLWKPGGISISAP